MIEKFNIGVKGYPRILLAPLDWGLGHATRCIPIIRHLDNSGCEVIIAAEGKQKELLQLEFPSIRMVHLKGYCLKYSNNRWKTIVKIISQIPKIVQAAKSEHSWIHRFCKEERIDAIISDNRYGFFLRGTPSIFITHQLAIKTPFGKAADLLLRRLNYKAVEKFNACWVPDSAGSGNLSGELSHPSKLPAIPVSYIGPLSRLSVKSRPEGTFVVVILLSGPEPQRTLLESLILSQLSEIHEPVVLVRGLPGQAIKPQINKDNVEVYNHLPADQMNSLIARAGVVISRPGYSTVMEMMPAGVDCIFIPTPGQSEQEYLAEYLSKRNLCVSATQNSFRLTSLITHVKERGLAKYHGKMGPDVDVIDSFLDSLKTKTKT